MMLSTTTQTEKIDVLLKLASDAAREAGKMLEEASTNGISILSNAGKDIKTSADIESEALVRKALEPTGIQILAEESAQGSMIDRSEPLWVVDPLDGTLNFSRGIPQCCVSIAYCESMRPLAGVVYDFQSDLLYAGLVGRGAHANEIPLKVSAPSEPGQAVLATGFPVCLDFQEPALRRLIKRIQQFKKVRVIGSAALSLAHVAGGRWTAGPVGLDWEVDIRAWNGQLSEDF